MELPAVGVDGDRLTASCRGEQKISPGELSYALGFTQGHLLLHFPGGGCWPAADFEEVADASVDHILLQDNRQVSRDTLTTAESL